MLLKDYLFDFFSILILKSIFEFSLKKRSRDFFFFDDNFNFFIFDFNNNTSSFNLNFIIILNHLIFFFSFFEFDSLCVK